jgi:uncharacterized cupin superfamily protein
MSYSPCFRATVIEDDGPHTLHPGDAACWLAGTATAHQVVNRSGAPCSYLILGSGAVPDVVHYPDREEVLYAFEDGTWRLQRTDAGWECGDDSQPRVTLSARLW